MDGILYIHFSFQIFVKGWNVVFIIIAERLQSCSQSVKFFAVTCFSLTLHACCKKNLFSSFCGTLLIHSYNFFHSYADFVENENVKFILYHPADNILNYFCCMLWYPHWQSFIIHGVFNLVDLLLFSIWHKCWSERAWSNVCRCCMRRC